MSLFVLLGFTLLTGIERRKRESQVVKSNSYYFQQSETVMQTLLEFEKEA